MDHGSGTSTSVRPTGTSTALTGCHVSPSCSLVSGLYLPTLAKSVTVIGRGTSTVKRTTFSVG